MKKFIIFSICLVLLVPLFTYAQTGGNKQEIDALNAKISVRKEKVKQLEESIEAYKKKISQTRTQAVSLANQMAVLDNHIVQVELDIEATQQKLDTLELELKALDLSILDKEETITKQKAIIAEFIRTIHEQSARGTLEILATYDNFSEFYDKVQYAETIEKDLGKSARTLRIAKGELEDKKTNTESRKEAYDNLKEELGDKKGELDGQSYVKQSLLASTQSSELKYKTLLGNLRSQYQQIENEITSIEKQVRQKLETQDALNEKSFDFDGTMSWPTPSRYITARFHDPDYPYRHVFEHNAVDIRASHGTPLRAAGPGYVARARYCSSAACYSYVMIVHSGGLSTVYGHMSRITVSTDQFVGRGEVIGYSGGTPGTSGAGPFVTGPHLHFEVRKNGIPVNPLNYLVRDY